MPFFSNKNTQTNFDMLFNQSILVRFNATHRKLIRDGLLIKRAITLQFVYEDFTSSWGSQIMVTGAQLKRLQVALNSGEGEIHLNVSKTQLADKKTGFQDALGAIAEDDEDSSCEVDDEDEDEDPTPTPSEGKVAESHDVQKITQAMANIEMTDSLTGVGLSPSQIKKLTTSCGVVTINLSKNGLEGSDMVFLTGGQKTAIANARLKGTGVRLALPEPAYQGLKKSPTS